MNNISIKCECCNGKPERFSKCYFCEKRFDGCCFKGGLCVFITVIDHSIGKETLTVGCIECTEERKQQRLFGKYIVNYTE